ncbi:hypothetical protein GCM10023321_64770 [Pseudonocardia eucalypti]|uniref:Uncharacterized protein n=1 Tax=Pseudonocardia eucalypti TaxID=648755 RepID=A0ABP9QYM2_9PSEU
MHHTHITEVRTATPVRVSGHSTDIHPSVMQIMIRAGTIDLATQRSGRRTPWRSLGNGTERG